MLLYQSLASLGDDICDLLFSLNVYFRDIPMFDIHLISPHTVFLFSMNIKQHLHLFSYYKYLCCFYLFHNRNLLHISLINV